MTVKKFLVVLVLGSMFGSMVAEAVTINRPKNLPVRPLPPTPSRA